jgi:hypothetical protein
MRSLVHIGKENTGLLTLKRNHLTRKPTRKPLQNNNILTFNSLSNMLFLVVEQKYLHGWKAGGVKILYL